MLSLSNAGVVKNGFKDVFGSSSPRRYSIDSIHNSKRYSERGVDVQVPVRNSVSCHDVCDDSFADFSREISPKHESSSRKVLPRVGNKKSDKILGENLSDLSVDQPKLTGADPDPLEQFVEENVNEKKIIVADQKVATHNNSATEDDAVMKEKAALLMNYLDKYSQEEDYSNREPVVEELIVPRKKRAGHICDDDEFHKHFHTHETKENEKMREELKEEDIERMILTPKKPQRDMAIYRKSLENLDLTAANDKTATSVVAPIRRKKSLSKADVPSPPLRPERSSKENLNSPSKELSYLHLDLKDSLNRPTTTTPPPSPVANGRADTPESEQLIDGDRQSNGTHAKKLKPSHFKMGSGLEFQMDYVMEDISNENDGSHNVTPSKILDPKTKKISVVSMPSPTASLESPLPFTPRTKKTSLPQLPKLVAIEAPASPGTKISLASMDSPISLHSPLAIEVPIEDPIKIVTKLETSPFKETTNSDAKSEHDSLSTSDTLSNDGSAGSSKTVVQCVVQKKIEDKKDITVLPAEESLFNQSSILLAEKSVENILSSDANMQILSNVLDDIFDKTVLEEFQNYLDTEGADLGDDKKLLGDHSDALIKDLKLRRVEKNALMPTSPVIEEVEIAEPPKREKSKKKKKKKDFQQQPSTAEEDDVSLESISDDGFTDLVKTTTKDDVTKRTLLAVSDTRPRRESIGDVDNWFNNHIDPAPSSLNVDHLRDVRMMRRGSDFMVGYDSGSTFPFGRSRHGSESSEFFEGSKGLKGLDSQSPKGSDSSLNNDSNSSLNLSGRDHSSLLRFVVQSPLANESSPPSKTMEHIKNDRNRQLKSPSPTIVVSFGDDAEKLEKSKE